ncbi:MAG: transaldolase [bacterium]|nr:transaldolase [bacterium]
MSNPLVDLGPLGQSVWYDSISRSLIESGDLARLISEDGLRGMTSNPAIFEKAISGSKDYTDDLRRHAAAGLTPLQIYEALAIGDIQAAADVLRPVFDASKGADGYVSLEVSPYLADDTQGTIDEALRLAADVDRPNLMIKVPGTPAGVPAIEALIGKGLNINVTLLFSQDNYAAVAEAYISGLEALAAAGGDVHRVASVASFFVSRIDVLVDSILAEKLQGETDAARRAAIEDLLGKVAIANAKLAYQYFKQLCAGDRWQSLASKGARVQRLLWASTGVKNPDYSDVLYVEQLIGPDTVNTVPVATFAAFRDHGVAAATLELDVADAQRVMASLGNAGVSMKDVTDKLQADAVRLFVEPFDKLLAAIESQSAPSGHG